MTPSPQMRLIALTTLLVAESWELMASASTATSARSIIPPRRVQKSPGRCRGLKLAGDRKIRSVPAGGGATPVEVVIDARRDHIDVLTDRVGAEYAAGRDASQNADRCEGDVAVTHEKV